ncbi:sorbitol/mannitol transport system permease protein [Variovorax sp. HW608]|nr:sorbitol/mannitol transport system permease protein [Variovorax sp. HW608]
MSHLPTPAPGTPPADRPSRILGGARRSQADAAPNRLLPRALMAPAVVALVLWMLAPLLMSIYFSFVNYNLMQPGERTFNGLANFEYFITDPDFWPAVWNTLVLIGSVIVITVVLGVALALLVNEPFPGRGIVRVLLISPFFVMPTVNALLWKHMMMNPIYGILADVWRSFGAEPVDWLTDLPLFSVIVMVAWQWLPFAVLIFITSLQSLDREQMEAARMDGATAVQRFGYLTLPHLARPMAVVIMIEMIFLLSVFAEIAITTAGGPGNESTNLTYMIFKQSLMNFDVGVASAGALFAVVLANIVAAFLIRIIGKNLD